MDRAPVSKRSGSVPCSTRILVNQGSPSISPSSMRRMAVSRSWANSVASVTATRSKPDLHAPSRLITWRGDSASVPWC